MHQVATIRNENNVWWYSLKTNYQQLIVSSINSLICSSKTWIWHICSYIIYTWKIPKFYKKLYANRIIYRGNKTFRIGKPHLCFIYMIILANRNITEIIRRTHFILVTTLVLISHAFPSLGCTYCNEPLIIIICWKLPLFDEHGIVINMS